MRADLNDEDLKALNDNPSNDSPLLNTNKKSVRFLKPVLPGLANTVYKGQNLEAFKSFIFAATAVNDSSDYPPLKIAHEINAPYLVAAIKKQRQTVLNNTKRMLVYDLLEGFHVHAWIVQFVIVFMIFLSIINDTISTVPMEQENWKVGQTVIEDFCLCVFVIEYCLRVWCIVDDHTKQYSDPVVGRLKYMTSLIMIVDFLSIFPSIVSQVATAGDDDKTIPALEQSLRLLRMFRLLKTETFFHGFDSLGRVIQKNQDMLSVGGLICFILIMFNSTLLYIIGNTLPNEEPDPNFDSVLNTMFLTCLVVTGQGLSYENMGYNWYLKVVLAFNAVISVAVFTVPAAILAWGFESEAERLSKIRGKIALFKQRVEAETKLTGQDFPIPTNLHLFFNLDGRDDGAAAATNSDSPQLQFCILVCIYTLTDLYTFFITRPNIILDNPYQNTFRHMHLIK